MLPVLQGIVQHLLVRSAFPTLLFHFASMGEYRWLVFPIAPRPSSLKLSVYKAVRPGRVVVLNLEALGLKQA
jgi:hypothetical protein